MELYGELWLSIGLNSRACVLATHSVHIIIEVSIGSLTWTKERRQVTKKAKAYNIS